MRSQLSRRKFLAGLGVAAGRSGEFFQGVPDARTI